MRHCRFAQASLIVVLVAGCSAGISPAPTAGTPVPPSAAPSQVSASIPASPSANPPTASPSAAPSTTADGWQRVVAQAALTGVDSSSLAWTGERFIAAGNGQLQAVASVPGGFLATGPSGPDSCLGGIWSAVDGSTWRCIAADPPFSDFVAYGAAASSTVEVVIGNDAANGAGSIVWIRPLP